MNDIFRDFLVTFVIVAAVFGMVYVHYMTRHREKMTMLERGVDISEINNRSHYKWIALKYGMVMIGIAIGILVGNILFVKFGLGNIVSYLSMTFLFGGISLIINFIIEKKYKK